MAHVQWSAGIDYISGALSKIKKGQHTHAKMLLATHRVAATTNQQCNNIYLREQPKRTTAVSTHELNIRARFTAVRAMVQERKGDLSKVPADQAAFIAQKDLANGKKTMNAYLWYVCGQQYDQSNG